MTDASAGSEPGAGGSLAATASGRVQAILQAAEASADAIVREAEEDAARIRERARADAGRMSESIEESVRRLEALHAELGALIASLRGGGEGVAAPAVTPPAGQDAAAPAAGEDVTGMRLIALNMALDGRPREETARFLAENYALADPEGLLDEVYASVGGSR